jgi:hypothetical protein
MRFERFCTGCSGLVVYSGNYGWIHTDGEGIAWQRCVCGWSGTEASMLAQRMRVSSTGCPECGSFNLTTDHLAEPDNRTPKERDEDPPPSVEYLETARHVLLGLMGEGA